MSTQALQNVFKLLSATWSGNSSRGLNSCAPEFVNAHSYWRQEQEELQISMDILEIFCAHGDVYIHIFKYSLSRPDICKNKNKTVRQNSAVIGIGTSLELWRIWFRVQLPKKMSVYTANNLMTTKEYAGIWESSFPIPFQIPFSSSPGFSDTLKRSKKFHSLRETHCGEACNIKRSRGHDRKKKKMKCIPMQRCRDKKRAWKTILKTLPSIEAWRTYLNQNYFFNVSFINSQKFKENYKNRWKDLLQT